MKIDHIGYLCSDIEKSVSQFEQLGYKATSEIFPDNEPDGGMARNVYICFMQNEQIRIELVSPINEESDVYSTLKRQGEGPYHICYQTEKLDDRIAELKSSGWLILKRPAKAMAFDYARVAFLFKRSVGLIELVEIKE